MDPSQVARDEDGVMRCRECGFRYNLTPDEIVDRSANGFDAVRAALAAVPEDRRGTRPSPNVWSVNAYTAHLVDAARLVTGRVRAIAEQDRAPLPYHDQDQAVEEGREDETPAVNSLARLEPAVAAFRSLAAGLSPEQWNRVGIHERAGEVTLREIAHDLPHELQHHATDIRRQSP